MVELNKKQVWYGLLKSKRGDSYVVFDPGLPTAGPDRIYLYHAQRKEMVPYLKDKVTGLLHELDKNDLVTVKEQLHSGWELAREQLLHVKDKEIDVQQSPAVAKKIAIEDVIDVPGGDDELDGFDLLDSGDSYHDDEMVTH